MQAHTLKLQLSAIFALFYTITAAHVASIAHNLNSEVKIG